MRLGGQQAHGYHGRARTVGVGRAGAAAAALERVDVEEARPVQRQAGQHAVVASSARWRRRSAARRSPAAGARPASRWRSPRRSRRRPGPAAARTGRRTPRRGARLPSPPVRYVRVATMSVQRRMTASSSAWSPVSTATSTAPAVEVQLAHGVAGHGRAPRGPVGGPASTPARTGPRPAARGRAGRSCRAGERRGSVARRSSATARRGPSRPRGGRRCRRAPPGPSARSTASAARRAMASSRSSPSARCQATAAWMRWPTQYSSWPQARSWNGSPPPTTWT